MSHFAVGDIQGCALSLARLLAKLPSDSQLIFCGDLINRGPRSLETLDLLMSLGQRAHCLLGNHDLHFLAVAQGFRRPAESDTLEILLKSPKIVDYIDWLRRKPLVSSLQIITERKPRGETFLFVHAGLMPVWSHVKATEISAQVQDALSGSEWLEYLAAMYGNCPNQWQEELPKIDKFRLAINAFTRCRLLFEDGSLELESKEGVGHWPTGTLAWFDHPGRMTNSTTVVFGHWSTLGYFQRDNLICLDSGCVWGGKLTAVELETRRVVQVDYAD